MVKAVDFSTARCIVEYGPGTGIFTNEIIRRKHPDCVFIIIEQNEEFSKRLADRFHDVEKVHIIHDDAAMVEEYIVSSRCILPPAFVLVMGNDV